MKPTKIQVLNYAKAQVKVCEERMDRHLIAYRNGTMDKGSFERAFMANYQIKHDNEWLLFTVAEGYGYSLRAEEVYTRLEKELINGEEG